MRNPVKAQKYARHRVRKEEMKRMEKFSYILVLVGVVGDQVSTRVALSTPYLYESNPFSVKLMTMGLWLPFDLVLLLVGIAIPWMIMRRWGKCAVLVYPFLYGAIRFAAAVWNISLLWMI